MTMHRSTRIRMRAAAALSCALAVVAGCGGGASTEENPATTPPPPAGYSGPPPASQDVQAFKLNVWDNLQASNRCGQCHGTGGQVPSFVRSDDINLAYEAANGVVELASPQDSTMVEKVGGGHNCWLAADSACADQLTVWIRNWAGQTLGGFRAVCHDGPPAARTVLLALPLVGRRDAAVAVLRGVGRRRRLRCRPRQGQPRLARPVAARRAPAQRVPQLLDGLRDGRERHAGRDPGFRRRGAGHAGRPGTRDLEGADALRRHRRERRQPVRPAPARSPTTPRASSRPSTWRCPVP
jgi:hypothetical protein